MGRLVLLVLAAASYAGSPGIDFASIPRRIAQPPKLTAAKPLYGCYLFGARGEKRMWAILDKSDAGHAAYDVLYLDLDADGDLTEAGEKIVAWKRGPTSARFKLDRLVDPATGAVHTDFVMSTHPRRVGCRLRWRGKTVVVSSRALNFADSLAKAPIFFPGCDGVLDLERFAPRPLKRGKSNRVSVYAGRRGSSEETFFAASNVIFARNESIRATLEYEDGRGKIQRVHAQLTGRC